MISNSWRNTHFFTLVKYAYQTFKIDLYNWSATRMLAETSVIPIASAAGGCMMPCFLLSSFLPLLYPCRTALFFIFLGAVFAVVQGVWSRYRIKLIELCFRSFRYFNYLTMLWNSNFPSSDYVNITMYFFCSFVFVVHDFF